METEKVCFETEKGIGQTENSAITSDLHHLFSNRSRKVARG